MKTKNWVWLTRDDDGGYSDVHLQKRPPPKKMGDGEYSGDANLCAALFEKATGFHLASGEMAKVEITVRRKK